MQCAREDARGSRTELHGDRLRLTRREAVTASRDDAEGRSGCRCPRQRPASVVPNYERGLGRGVHKRDQLGAGTGETELRGRAGAQVLIAPTGSADGATATPHRRVSIAQQRWRYLKIRRDAPP